MRKFGLVLGIAVVLTCSQSPARAAYTVVFTEDGANVVATGAGTYRSQRFDAPTP